MTFEEALKIGASNSDKVADKDWKETSIRFHLDGLYKWLYDYSGSHEFGSTFYLLRDSVWQWQSFCENNLDIATARRWYLSLLKNITHNTDYTDLAERMDEHVHITKVGWRSHTPTNILIPRKVATLLGDSSSAIGIDFSLFYQLGVGWCLSRNSEGLYSKWVESKITPLFNEVMEMSKRWVKIFEEISNTVAFRKENEIVPARTLQ